MPVPGIILHHSNYVLTRGGMEAIIQFHLAEAKEDRAIAFREHGAEASGQVIPLGVQPRTTLGNLRQRYRKAIRQSNHRISIYHNCWACELVHDLDPAPLKLGFLHSDFPGFDRVVRHHAPFLDGVINIHPVLHERCRKLLPGWESGRFLQLDYPAVWPDSIEEKQLGLRDRCIIGISGRVSRAQKRLDRLEHFLDCCEKHLDSYSVEILGKGAYETVLRQNLSGRDNVQFLGWKEGDSYWDVLSKWRYIVFLSDYEGTSISMIEAAGGGVLPVYPDFHPGMAPTALLSGEHLYPVGDVEAASRCVSRMEAAYAETHTRFSQTASRIREMHDPSVYRRAFQKQLASVPGSRDKGDEHPPIRLPRWLTLTFYNWRMKKLRFGPAGIVWHK